MVRAMSLRTLQIGFIEQLMVVRATSLRTLQIRFIEQLMVRATSLRPLQITP